MLLFTPETDITLFTGIKIHNFKKKILLLENLEKHKEILKEKVKEKISKFSKYRHTKTEGTTKMRYLRRELVVGNTSKKALRITVNS